MSFERIGSSKTITVDVNALSARRLHVPVLLNRYGYTVYRGG